MTATGATSRIRWRSTVAHHPTGDAASIRRTAELTFPPDQGGAAGRNRAGSARRALDLRPDPRGPAGRTTSSSRLDTGAIIRGVPLTDLPPQATGILRRSAALLTAGVIAVLVSAGCSADQGTVEVSVRVSVCAQGGQKCFGLSVRDADVTVSTQDGRVIASGKTDYAGEVTFKVDRFGALDVVARSPVLENGEAVGTADLASGGGSTVSFGVPMSPDMTTLEPWTSSS